MRWSKLIPWFRQIEMAINQSSVIPRIILVNIWLSGGGSPWTPETAGDWHQDHFCWQSTPWRPWWTRRSTWRSWWSTWRSRWIWRARRSSQQGSISCVCSKNGWWDGFPSSGQVWGLSLQQVSWSLMPTSLSQGWPENCVWNFSFLYSHPTYRVRTTCWPWKLQKLSNSKYKFPYP